MRISDKMFVHDYDYNGLYACGFILVVLFSLMMISGYNIQNIHF